MAGAGSGVWPSEAWGHGHGGHRREVRRGSVEGGAVKRGRDGGVDARRAGGIRREEAMRRSARAGVRGLDSGGISACVRWGCSGGAGE